MNILFVTLCPIELNTSAMIRNNALIRGLVENGNKIDVLTIPSNNSNPFFDKTLKWDENINFINVEGNTTYNSLVQDKDSFVGKIKMSVLPFLRVVYHSFSLFDNTIYIARKLDKGLLPKDNYDFIISSSDPKSSHLAVIQLIKSGLKYGKWIQYWGDPMAIDITKKSIYPKSFVKLIEKRLFSYADKIVYVSPFTLNEQVSNFPGFRDKMCFIPIPYLKKKFYKQRELKKTDIKLGYFGDYNSSIRNINNLYEACKKENISLVVAGNSDLKLTETNNISILPRVSQKKVEYLEEDCDVLVCILNKKGSQIPGKIYHYASTNKPILVILDGEKKDQIRQYLKKFNRYILCDNNYQSIHLAVNEVKNSSKMFSPSKFFEPTAIAKDFLGCVEEQ